MKALKRSQTSSSTNSTSPSSSSSSSSWIHLRSLILLVASSSPAACSSSERARIKSPWSHRKRKHVLSLRRWNSLFTPDGKFRDGGVKFLKKVRSGGVDPVIRAEVWPFLLGVYDLGTSKEERGILRTQNRKEYEKLRRHCQRLLKHDDSGTQIQELGRISSYEDRGDLVEGLYSPDFDDMVSARESLSSGERSPYGEDLDHHSITFMESSGSRRVTDRCSFETESSDSDSSADPEISQTFPSAESREENDNEMSSKGASSSIGTEVQSKLCSAEDFATWQKIIRLDAVRANEEWIIYSQTQSTVSEDKAHRAAEAVGLKDYNHLEPCRIFHAARLVAILEAYALYDPEIGYCQGMSDLLSPIVAVIKEDHEAFWCFVGFMKKARHNFRLDEVGIKRQLGIVSKIIKCKDSHLYRHLENLRAEGCFFVYRMVIVLFSRELTFKQTICLWEVMWADQAAVRAGIGKSAWSRIRQQVPPTDDLLLYAIAASVLQRRKQIIERYSSMDEIVKECNNMAGHLDVWKLLDDAHNLVVSLHDKI